MAAVKNAIGARISSAPAECLSHLNLQERPVMQAVRLIHAGKMALCAELEDIADRLPGNVDELACLSLAERLLPGLRHAHAYEENVLFPLYDQIASYDRASLSTDRLRTEHVADAFFADDITAMLFELGHAGRLRDPETFGFMLRGFFEGLRRHVAFEVEHVAAVIADRTVRSLT
ncbi:MULTISPECIES: hemerythrin domain-containing protein [unclassified Rhizobium]|uniref:hemerythrin domain-containing protein n=1 Tax=unclassified Rhizobium TaxID=2613769 RepID=UPI000ABACF40|nr:MULTISPECIES: hemerythrin domain-containing protein [unclassified Rhizobium]